MLSTIRAALILIVLAFVAAVTFHFTRIIFSDAELVITTAAVGAFFGAFFAFLFLRIADWLRAFTARRRRAREVLVRLQHRLNALLSALDDNAYIIDGFRNGIEKSRPNTDIFVWHSRLQDVGTLDPGYIELLDVGLINDHFVLDTHLYKLNKSMETINYAYGDVKNALIAGRMTTDNYMRNLENVQSNLAELRQHIAATMEEVKANIAAGRVFLRKVKWLAPILRWVVRRKDSVWFETRFERELKRLDTEIEQVKKESRERLERIKTKGGS